MDGKPRFRQVYENFWACGAFSMTHRHPWWNRIRAPPRIWSARLILSPTRNEPLASYEGEDTRLVRDYQRYGRTFSGGVSYRF